MNDMERDLRALFEERARRAEAPAQAPRSVLGRGRRREARTIAMGVVASVVVIAMALAVSNFVRTAVDTVPGGTPQLPERATSIGGIPVTAPAGWTLIDDLPLLSSFATTSQSCTFSGSGTAVDQNGSPIVASPAPEPSASCTSTPTSLPAGIPMLQLANYDLPLLSFVCTAGDQPATPLPADGVAIYVGSFPNGVRAADVTDACPGAAAFNGENVNTFSIGDMALAAVVVAGPNASQTDLDVARAFLGQPFFGHALPALQPPAGVQRVGPAYVLATGGSADRGWRLEAAVGESTTQGGRPNANPMLIGIGSGVEKTVSLVTADPPGSLGYFGSTETVQGQLVQWGVLAAPYTGIEIVGADGSVTPADVYQWPAGVADAIAPVTLPTGGRIWIATPPEEGQLHPTEGPTAATAAATAAPQSPAGGQLQARTDDAGNLVLYGNDLGHNWEIHHENGQMVFSVDGAAYDGFPMVNGEWREFDVDGGSYIVGIFDPSIDRLVVATTPVGSTGTLIDGRSFPAQDTNGRQGRVWMIPLAGTGAGVLRPTDGTPPPLGWHITWPSIENIDQGSILRAGGDGTTYAWALQWRDPHCMQLRWDTQSGGGLNGCLPPWHDLEGNGQPFVGGQPGFDPNDIAGVAIVLPADASIESFRTSSTTSGVGAECTTIRVESNFAGTQLCVFPLSVGASAHLNIGGMGADALPIDVTANSGTFDVSGATTSMNSTGIGATMTPTPSPTP